MTSSTDRTSDNTENGAWTVVHRTVFPSSEGSSMLPLYLDTGAGIPGPSEANLSPRQHEVVSVLRDVLSVGAPAASLTDVSWERFSARFPENLHVSFASYFNAFPASYWQEHTDVDVVRLDVVVEGSAHVELFRSNARGKYVRIDAAAVSDGSAQFVVPLKSFGDGGWLWFDFEAAHGAASVRSATWSAPAAAAHRGPTRLTVAIPSFNMPEACVEQIERFAQHPEVMEAVERVVIVDQGTKRVREFPGFTEAESALGDKLKVIEQANLGGSGGFSRGMLEMLEDPRSTAVLLLDDDAEAEPESILRAAVFNDYARVPSIVGGHMLNANDRTVLHSYGETINFSSFWWEPVDPSLSSLDFRKKSIRTTPALSRRLDVPYNGWWMCLIPREVVERIGLSLPMFIKWDDAEYSLRAGEAGITTVTLPGMAAWHMPWDEKDDGLDWQAYFHQRNRWVAAMLHSPSPRGGTLARKSFASDLKHLLSMQYTAAVLRGRALEDVLRGPRHMLGTLASSASEARATAGQMSDGRLISRRADYPAVGNGEPRPAWSRPPTSILWFVAGAIGGILRQVVVVRADAPQKRVRAAEAKWWHLASLDEALVSNAAGSGVWVYRRDRRLFWRELRRSVRAHLRLWASWPRLSRAYRAHAHELSSAAAWARVFDES
ncbi:hypothetical protein BO218_14960 [Microbacterium paludicola]|jgi:galactofuranosylgalactofuranosylrhamnosyl-N-acetylglucosaminyl-diphospho-decaprenol beta-1,5/1,6-galactofuranosyltransferase|nr:glycosyltransferase [Microbacterium sp.]APF35345.1 hypothetical protein BO218_14960 [Microbacterium paludicola]